ncbi:MAG TPA: indole-3-glycerol-phosphate synthase [Polyangiales bacterium]|nr:indole-3-glycerol-phosphate synthase [Polyangiales bacterium]
MNERDYLSPILERKARENVRRARHVRAYTVSTQSVAADRGELACQALQRPAGQPPRIIAEIKRASPSAGSIRSYARGDIPWIANEYVLGGAAAVSVLCDGPGFGGSVLDLRRASQAISAPLLFKEFVLDELQVQLARRVGAHMVLLIVRALPGRRLHALCDAVLAAGMAPVVEAANADEVVVALGTRARIIGVNARDLRTFRVDPQAAHDVLRIIPADRIAVHMSGVRAHADFREIAQGRADAMLVGESLMRAQQPSAKLRELAQGHSLRGVTGA